MVVWWSYGSVFRWCFLLFRCSRLPQGYTSRGCPLGLIFFPDCPFPNQEIRHVLGGTRLARPINLALWETPCYHSR
ncbi:hypothetical protein JTB14_004366 [Gonioctena quinquepunctata]|nr:hypothetical protein JTB14_004366 [Gonioctena quinquepunctata]